MIKFDWNIALTLLCLPIIGFVAVTSLNKIDTLSSDMNKIVLSIHDLTNTLQTMKFQTDILIQNQNQKNIDQDKRITTLENDG